MPCDFIIDETPNISDYGKIFPISALREIQQKYAHVDGLKCEVQMWDPTVCTIYLEHNSGKNSEVFGLRAVCVKGVAEAEDECGGRLDRDPCHRRIANKALQLTKTALCNFSILLSHNVLEVR